MIQPGMMFGGEGPVMQGTWYNPNTGDAFTVRDSFFEDNQYIVTTTDGRYLRYDQLQSYIQTDMKLEDLKQMKADKIAAKEDAIPSEVSSLIDHSESDLYFGGMITPEDEDILLLTKPHKPSQPVKIGNIYEASAPVQQPVTNMNAAIIDKALKNTVQPKMVINIDWDDFPSKQIEMLYDIMGISEEEIVEWYLSNIQMHDIVEALEESIKNRIVTKPVEALLVDPIVEVDTTTEVVTEPTTTSKKLGEPKATKAAKESKEKKTKMTKK